MPAFNDLTGQRFHRWTVVRRDNEKRCRVHWICQCDCGTTKPVSGVHLTNGNSTNCGCEKAEKAKRRFTTHGLTGTQEHGIWMAMISRCTNPNHKSWLAYGGRGIEVCARWRSSFENFLADMGHRPSPRYSVDRYPNKNGNYEPGNCRWATAKQQARNVRKNILVDFDGATVSLSEACERTGINYDAAKYRVKAGHDWRGIHHG